MAQGQTIVDHDQTYLRQCQTPASLRAHIKVLPKYHYRRRCALRVAACARDYLGANAVASARPQAFATARLTFGDAGRGGRVSPNLRVPPQPQVGAATYSALHTRREGD